MSLLPLHAGHPRCVAQSRAKVGCRRAFARGPLAYKDLRRRGRSCRSGSVLEELRGVHIEVVVHTSGRMLFSGMVAMSCRSGYLALMAL